MAKFLASLLIICCGLLSFECAAKGDPDGVGFAVANGNMKRVKQFLSADSTLRTSKSLGSLMFIAAKRGQPEMVAFLISQGANPNETGFMGMTALTDMASGWGLSDDEKCVAVAKVLIAGGADVNAIDDGYHSNALYRAAEAGKIKLVSLLLEKGADVSLADNWKRTPLHMAAGNGYKDIAALLIQAGAKIDAKDKYGQTPLQWAREMKPRPETDEVITFLETQH